MKNSDILSSPELLGLLAELIVYPSSRWPSSFNTPIFKISKPFGLKKANVHLEPPCEGGNKVV